MAKLGDVIDYLKHNNVQYEVIEHAPAFSAHEVAVVSHVPEKDLAKTLIVNADGKFYMVVMPADHRLDDHLMHDVLKAKHVHLATEEDLRQIFPDCEVGAMPPFGNLYALPVYVDKTLADDDVDCLQCMFAYQIDSAQDVRVSCDWSSRWLQNSHNHDSRLKNRND